MPYLGGGIFEYKFNVTRPGNITISIVKYGNFYIYEYFTPRGFGLPKTKDGFLTNDLSFDWNTGKVLGHDTDDLSVRFRF